MRFEIITNFIDLPNNAASFIYDFHDDNSIRASVTTDEERKSSKRKHTMDMEEKENEGQANTWVKTAPDSSISSPDSSRNVFQVFQTVFQAQLDELYRTQSPVPPKYTI